MKIQGTDLIVSIDPLSYACGVEVLSGTLRQSYDKSDKAYSPSRIAIPLVLLPWIGAYGDDHVGCDTSALCAVSRMRQLSASFDRGCTVFSSHV